MTIIIYFYFILAKASMGHWIFNYAPVLPTLSHTLFRHHKHRNRTEVL